MQRIARRRYCFNELTSKVEKLDRNDLIFWSLPAFRMKLKTLGLSTISEASGAGLREFRGERKNDRHDHGRKICTLQNE
jgi:hypothetical protein